jgi:hypothetical protein
MKQSLKPVQNNIRQNRISYLNIRKDERAVRQVPRKNTEAKGDLQEDGKMRFR